MGLDLGLGVVMVLVVEAGIGVVSRPGFWNPVSEGIRLANPVLVINCFKKKFY